ncbi:DUF6941 family protein [Mesorhizobium sp. NPDC059025]|uniref:DUF6941 family protein n=1 Tax=unclassified Mesorhizobium TaxID=325217 RepID=UPI003685DACC
MLDVENLRFEILFCDDVRQEASGKHILIGVFGTDILPSNLPGVLPLAMYLRVFGMTKGDHHFRITLVTSDGDWRGEIDGQTRVMDDTTASIFPFGAIPIHIEKPGAIIANLSIDGSNAVPIGSITVRAPIEPSDTP